MNSFKSEYQEALFHWGGVVFFVFIGYILDPVILGAFLPQDIRESLIGLALLIVLRIFKVFYYSGFYAAMIEVVSDEYPLLSFERIRVNALTYWKIYLCLLCIPAFFHFLSFGFSPYLNFPLSLIAAVCDPLILYMMAAFIVSTKYLQSMKLKKEVVRIDKKVIVIMMLLTIANMAFSFQGAILTEIDSHLYRIFILAARFIHVLIFFYIAVIILKKYPDIKKSFQRENELLLVAPLGGGVLGAASTFFQRFYPPIFVVLRSLTPDYYRIREYNQVFWRNSYFEGAKLVAISCFTSNTPEAYKIAKEFKRRGSKVIMGGPHVMFLPEEALEYCDSVVIGDAEAIWEGVLKDYEAGTLKRIYAGPAIENYYECIDKAADRLPSKYVGKYIETGRGCKFDCGFCVIPAISGERIRKRPVEEVVALIKKAKKYRKDFLFLDNNIYVDPAYAKKLFEAIKPLNITWRSSSSLDIAKNEKVLRLAKESGCKALLIGYEIAEGADEKEMSAKFGMAKNYRTLTRKIKKQGIGIKGHFIYGFDSDNGKSLFNLWKFCFLIFPFATIVSFLTPFPGSRLFDDMLKENRLLNLNWRNYGVTKIVFKHKKINPFLINVLYPAVYFFFALTTSKLGLIILILSTFFFLS